MDCAFDLFVATPMIRSSSNLIDSLESIIPFLPVLKRTPMSLIHDPMILDCLVAECFRVIIP